MKKCIFIIPYFGVLPNYFKLFLKTCAYNKEFNWIIFTDDNTIYEYPQNVKKINMTFEELKEIINKKFDFEVSLKKPYKLCDFKPAYGYIFEEYIKGYKFWGHCDVDTIMGDLNKFITNELLSKYDKLFCLGHMILYKNNYENNRVFMAKIDNRYLYKESFQNENITVFDETFENIENVDWIFSKKDKKVLRLDWSINFRILPTKFIRTQYNAKNNEFIIEKYKEAIYIWDNGSIYRIIKKDGKLEKEEFMYMHLQARSMKVDKEIYEKNIFKIIPNKFLVLEEKEITFDNFRRIKKSEWNIHYIKTQYKWKRNKVKRILTKMKKLNIDTRKSNE